MTIEDLKANVEAYRQGLKSKSGVCMFSENGPVGMSVIDALVATIEAQQKEIDDLQRGMITE
ncbi:MAG: hypothetical protein ABIU95_07590 [Burkholderiales bacterium]